MRFFTCMFPLLWFHWHAVKAMPLNPTMFEVSTVEELKDATRLHQDSSLKDAPRHSPRGLQEESSPKLAADYNGPSGFYHGVASGDPLPEGVIIWTRWTPQTISDVVMIEFRIARIETNRNILALEDHLDPIKNPNIKRGVVKTTGDTDWVVKLDLQGLKPHSSYVYGFVGPNGETSRVGLTKTAPAPDAQVEKLQYAVFSCADFLLGYFHAYDVASTISELDFWVHVGDYIYEYGTHATYYDSSPADRKNLTEPVWEIVTLQDYRLRYAQYHRDEGLQNLRARAPQISTWDDHETMDNSYGDGTEANSGATNHQTVCPANRSSPIEEKQAAQCDIDEGPVLERFDNAGQAYMEWMPLRKGPFGMMGAVNTDLTQVIEWGSLATLVLLDSRVSERSKEPAGTTHFPAFAPAFLNLNVSTYKEEPALSQFQAIHNAVMEEINNPNYTMVGSKLNFLEETFAASKAAGKPWQIYGAATMVGPSVPPNLHTIHKLVESPQLAEVVQQLTEATLEAPQGGLLRAAVAMAITGTPWSGDDYNGYGAERTKLLDICKTSANNCMILGGDLHDAWAWQLFEGGTVQPGEPVAINLGTSGVTATGWEAAMQPVFAPIQDALGGPQAVNRLVSAGFEDVNPGLVFGSVGRRGFFVVTASKQNAKIDYFGFDAETMLTDYEAARSTNLTAPFTCDGSLLTVAGDPGSLMKVEDGCTVQFDTERPQEWRVPLTTSQDGTTDDGLATLSECGMDACLVNLLQLDSEEKLLSGGAKAGIVIAVILCAAAVGFWVYKK